MPLKTFMETYLYDILPFILVIVCVLSLSVSNILFWILSPLFLFIYFLRKYNFWIILGTSLYLFIPAFLLGGEIRKETIDVASHLLILSITLGISSFTGKHMEA